MAESKTRSRFTGCLIVLAVVGATLGRTVVEEGIHDGTRALPAAKARIVDRALSAVIIGAVVGLLAGIVIEYMGFWKFKYSMWALVVIGITWAANILVFPLALPR